MHNPHLRRLVARPMLFLPLFLGFLLMGSAAAPKAYAQEVLAGYDLFETPPGMSTWLLPPIPPDFFAPGSAPFTGTICPGGESGKTDTTVRRVGSMNPDSSPATVPIEIVGLNLVSCQPITVTYPDHGPELWNVQVTLSNLMPQQQGQITVTKTHPNGGTFDSTLPVTPRFIFTRVQNPLERGIDCGTPLTTTCPPYLFQTDDVPWTYEPCPPDMLRVPGVTSNFCPSVTGSGRVKTMATGGFSTHAYLPTRAPLCGNAIVEPPEQCDDGNNAGGDGCDALCRIEPSGPTCNGLPATIIGTPGNDNLVGTNGDDVIVGLQGNDTIEGKKGNDVLCGNEGNDKLEGGQGNDVLLGDQGDDKLIGNAGDDRIFGDAGDDVLEGHSGDDHLFGGAGRDKIEANKGSDVACGGTEDDRLEGGANNDRMDGGAGKDKMTGSSGTDICVNGESLSSCENTTTPVPECGP